jgi:hypothetical protein
MDLWMYGSVMTIPAAALYVRAAAAAAAAADETVEYNNNYKIQIQLQQSLHEPY